MRVTIERQASKPVTINSETKSITIGTDTTTVVITNGRGPRGAKGDPGDIESITPAIADAIVGKSTLLDGEVNGATPLTLYNIARGN